MPTNRKRQTRTPIARIDAETIRLLRQMFADELPPDFDGYELTSRLRLPLWWPTLDEVWAKRDEPFPVENSGWCLGWPEAHALVMALYERYGK